MRNRWRVHGRRILRRLQRPGLKAWLPKSLYGRSMLIIVLPVAIMQVAVMWAFFDRHWLTVTSRLSQSVAGDVAVVTDFYDQAPGPEQVAAMRDLAARRMSLSVVYEEAGELPTSTRSNLFRVLDRALRRALNERVDAPFWFDTTRYPENVLILVEVEGGLLRFVVPRERVFASTGHIFLLWIIGATTILTAVSLAYIRNQVRPIERLAAAADKFGRGQDAPEFRATGATEVRQAAAAFLDMRERIARQIEQRTAILAGVSHDLRTPLTRFKLQLAIMPDGPDKSAMLSDVADMEAVLSEYLAFARGAGHEDTEPVDLAPLVEDAIKGSGAGDVAVAIDGDLRLTARASSVKRCLENLIANAAAYGEDVSVTARRTSDSIEIAVEDNGPGIPEPLREEAFKPFHQLDRTGDRKDNRMGYGLGLAIARDVARGHGGDVVLDTSPTLGGLKATVRLPV